MHLPRQLRAKLVLESPISHMKLLLAMTAACCLPLAMRARNLTSTVAATLPANTAKGHRSDRELATAVLDTANDAGLHPLQLAGASVQ
jgi:hypothetical protein